MLRPLVAAFEAFGISYSMSSDDVMPVEESFCTLKGLRALRWETRLSQKISSQSERFLGSEIGVVGRIEQYEGRLRGCCSRLLLVPPIVFREAPITVLCLFR